MISALTCPKRRSHKLAVDIFHFRSAPCAFSTLEVGAGIVPGSVGAQVDNALLCEADQHAVETGQACGLDSVLQLSLHSLFGLRSEVAGQHPGRPVADAVRNIVVFTRGGDRRRLCFSIFPALITGNPFGGVALAALLNHAPVAHEIAAKVADPNEGSTPFASASLAVAAFV